MPSNQINPFNYNIDSFDSSILGPTTDTNFRTYLESHNLQVPNSVISGVIGNPWQSRNTEYDVSQSNPNVVDAPNLQDVANTPSVYNNLTNPRQVNLTNNLPNLNPEIQNLLGQTTPQQAGLGQDVTTLFNPTLSNLDLPSVEDASQVPSTINNFTNPKQDNLTKNPTPLELLTWNSIAFGAVYQQYSGDYDTSYGVPQTLKIGYVGNIEEWVNPGGNVTTSNEARRKLFALDNNKYGPTDMIAYEMNGGDEIVAANTGLIQYSTGVQGDFRDQLLSRTLGVGVIPFSTIGSGINFKPDGTNISQLDEIARKRRGQELLNRIKLNFTDDTVGRLNISPFKLLGGGNLIEQNYTITVPKSGLGKAAQFAADLAGFNLPTSIIPTNAFGIYGEDKTLDNGRKIDITNDILDYTGSGQKSLLYNALYINKYGPTLESAANPPTTKLGKIVKEKLGAGQAPNTQNYLNYQPEKQNTGNRNTSLIDNINEKIKGVLGKSSENPINLRSKVFEDTSDVTKQGSDQYGGFYGKYETAESVGKDTAEITGFNGQVPTYEDKRNNLTTYNGTPFENNPTDISVTNERFDWRADFNGKNSFKKGLLKYTQELVNKSKLGSAAGYIGYFDTDDNVNTVDQKNWSAPQIVHSTGVGGKDGPKTKPKLPSKGNVARNYDFTNDQGGDYYCRSWSSRRKYHTWDNLIRSDGNWWRKQAENTNMTMNWDGLNGGVNTGIPKIAWNTSDAKSLGNVGLVNNVNAALGAISATITNVGAIKGKVIPYMLSIENLAWKDAPQYSFLPDCEKGPNGGRIMWFPPYDIDFSDSSSLSWDTTSFIGRGENIYTYNHTERTGTLDFKLVVDHPAALNQLKKDFSQRLSDESIHSFFAGCDADTLKQLFSGILDEGVDAPYTEYKEPETTPITPCEPSEPPFKTIKLYFENSRTDGPEVNGATAIGRDPITDLLNGNYEAGGKCNGTNSECGGAIGPPVPSLVNVNADKWVNDGTFYPCGPAGTNSYKYLNEGKLDQLITLAKFLSGTEDGKNYKIKIVGYTSAANPNSGYNKKLGLDRAINTKIWLHSLMTDYQKEIYLEGNPEYGTYPMEDGEGGLYNNSSRWYEPESQGNEGATASKCTSPCDDGNPCDNLESGQANSRTSKESRYVEITLEPNLDIQVGLLKQINDKNSKAQKDRIAEENKKKQEVANQIANRFVTECDYFEQMKNEQPFVYQSLTDKIKYFHPAFHSTSPEGFNSRLTFLLQCTRQGPQMMDPEVTQNMVFGRPPVCVLRIGDFYHTKIIIDNVNITYDPLQWDLNPEGIGVQPMIAKVSISFKFIGGSSLGGPIKQLQNAVSYNFFANTGVYQPARVLSETTGKRLKFIYGAFLTPDDANNAYAEVSASILEAEKKANEEKKESVNTTADGKGAATDQDTQQKVEKDAPKDDTKATQGDTKAPSNNSAGPSLSQSTCLATADPNSTTYQYFIKTTKPPIPCATGSYIPIKITDPNGYKSTNLGAVQFYKNNESMPTPYGGSGVSATVIDNLPTGLYTLKVDYLFNGTNTQLTLSNIQI